MNIQLCGGTIQAIAEGTRAALQLSRQASKERRQEFPLSKLNVGLECAARTRPPGSRPIPRSAWWRTTSWRTAARRSSRKRPSSSAPSISSPSVPLHTQDVGKKILDTIRGREAIVALGIDLRGSNPSLDNIRGGLSTIEEKALGAMSKAGKSKVIEVLSYGQSRRSRACTSWPARRRPWSRSPASRRAAASCPLLHRCGQRHRSPGGHGGEDQRQPQYAQHHAGQHRLRRTGILEITSRPVGGRAPDAVRAVRRQRGAHHLRATRHARLGDQPLRHFNVGE